MINACSVNVDVVHNCVIDRVVRVQVFLNCVWSMVHVNCMHFTPMSRFFVMVANLIVVCAN